MNKLKFVRQENETGFEHVIQFDNKLELDSCSIKLNEQS